jgi:hypothetical protein
MAHLKHSMRIKLHYCSSIDYCTNGVCLSRLSSIPVTGLLQLELHALLWPLLHERSDKKSCEEKIPPSLFLSFFSSFVLYNLKGSFFSSQSQYFASIIALKKKENHLCKEKRNFFHTIICASLGSLLMLFQLEFTKTTRQKG